ncbi:hypothetical protein EUX98_g5214 [Antrodiella citrinella]|uniref:Enoyl reductase (ER) domain-containing protein n=1 Tax=Antrodiella citrinella TaxID=2447956 RepID=A0A4S4MUV1_9APHY|nr:hypothetical protein EUX98_g5214 [Antrodiella citrinella]
MSQTPSEQKALFLVAKKGDWKVDVTPVLRPKAGEVLIRIEAAALSPFDWKVKDFGIVITEYPTILGCDSAGTVVEVGEGVTNVAVGDNGEFTVPRAIFQQYTLASADLVAKIPSNLTFDEAAAISGSAASVTIGLYAPKIPMGGAGLTPPWAQGGRNKYTGVPILVIGGASSIGQAVIQFAKLSGFSPIIATASPANNDLLKSLGATHVIDRSADLPSALSTLTSLPTALRYIFDAVGQPDTQSVAYGVLASGGTLITVGHVPIKNIMVEKEVVVLWGVFYIPTNRRFGVEVMSHLTELLENGDIKSNAVEVLPGGLSAILDGLDRLRKQNVSAKKLVVHPQETA